MARRSPAAAHASTRVFERADATKGLICLMIAYDLELLYYHNMKSCSGYVCLRRAPICAHWRWVCRIGNCVLFAGMYRPVTYAGAIPGRLCIRAW
jgi:hypothetical protein